MKGKYNLRGVSAEKEDVHAAIRNLDTGLFSNTFCKVIPDVLAGDPEFCNVVHADGAGTKSALAYMYWKETGDVSVWEGIAQDAIVMNTDDVICVGALDHFVISSTIGRNKGKIPAEVIAALIQGTESCLSHLRTLGLNIHSAGGETADVGDLVRSIIVDSTLVCRMKRSEVIQINIQDGDLIIGLSSAGKANYEPTENSGIGSNGLTSARHDLFKKEYAVRFPESFDPDIPEAFVYSGNYALTDASDSGWDMGKLLLSPTRTYYPVIHEIVKRMRNEIHGIIHCTGGGQTKVLHFVDNLHIIKDNCFDVPEIFRKIGQESGMELQEMYRVFNMGHRMELYCQPKHAKQIIAIAEHFGIEARCIGHCENATGKKLSISSNIGSCTYP